MPPSVEVLANPPVTREQPSLSLLVTSGSVDGSYEQLDESFEAPTLSGLRKGRLVSSECRRLSSNLSTRGRWSGQALW